MYLGILHEDENPFMDDHMMGMDWFNFMGLEYMWIVIFIYFSIGIFIGIFIYNNAKRRGITYSIRWGLTGLILNIFGLLIYILLPKTTEQLEQIVKTQGIHKETIRKLRICSNCGKEIENVGSLNCPFCGSNL